jgi:CheY-like chemotaxis protein
MIALKWTASTDAVLADTRQFLQQAPLRSLAPSQHQRAVTVENTSHELSGRKVLIVDDDIRNIFALTGALEEQGISVLNAENGKEGLEVLQNNAEVDAVLMDIMMPELDGYDTIRMIRRLKQFKDIPIIAVTAKAMKGDREKCLEAGASDYIAKPVNVEQLMSLLRVWVRQ